MSVATPPADEPVARQGQSAHILVVEDDEQAARILRGFLRRELDCHITMAPTGAAARAALLASVEPRAEPIDLVLLDMNLPDAFGRDILVWLREHHALRYTRVIILTALNSREELIAALSAGADDYVTKPTGQTELLARVKTTLRSHELEKQLQQQSRQLDLLNRISTRMVARRDLSRVLSEAVDGVRQLLGAQLGAVFLYEARDRGLHCPRASTGGPAEPVFHTVPEGHGLVGKVFAAQKPMRLERVADAPAFSPTYDAPAGYAVHNLLLAPLRAGEKCVGVLLAANHPDGPLSDFDFDLFLAMANAVSRAVENAYLFGHIQQQGRDIARSRDRIQAVIDGIQHAIYTVDPDWRIQAINQSKRDELTGTASPIGQTCYRLFFGRERPCLACAVPTTLAHGTTTRWTEREPQEDYLAREWDVTAYPIPAPRAERPQAVVVWEDITEERRLEYSLLQAAKMAAIGQLATGVAHELNNPLSVIIASTQMLKLATDESSDSFELVDLIDQAGDRAGSVVRELLDFARQKSYTFVDVDVNESIRQAMMLVNYQLQTANIEVDLNLAPELPPVTASAEHLKSVWINVMINARDALLGRPDGRRLDVSTRLIAQEKRVQIIFHDNGQGMSAAQRERIFEPFYTTKEPGQGTGLGLSTSHRIIDQHGGEIEVQSEPDKGSSFVIRLPVSA